MSSRRLHVIAVLVVFAIACLTALFLWDRSNSDVIAKGVSVAGIDVSDLNSAEAKHKLQKKLGKSLNRPLTVRFRKKRSELNPKDVGLQVRVVPMVDTALDKSRKGGLFGRSWRRIAGGSLEEILPAQVAFSNSKLNSWIKNYIGKVNLKPQNAEVSYTATSVSLLPGRNGVQVKEKELRNELKQALVSRGNRRTVSVKARTTKPKVTRESLKDSVPLAITIDRQGTTVRLWKNFKLEKSYTVAVGQVGYETPAGLYNIQDKQVNPTWTKPDSDWVPKDERGDVVPGGDPENPLKSRWMGFSGSAGFHGTDNLGSLGTAASHGCIRMSIPDVKDLYSRVEVGVPVYID